MSARTIHSALVALVQSCLTEADSSFRVTDEIAKALYETPSRSARVAVMVSPVRYCEVLLKRPTYDGAGRAGFSQVKSVTKSLMFEINVFWETAAGSAALFNEAITKLLDTLDRTEYLVCQDASEGKPRLRVTLGCPDVQQDIVDMWIDTDNRERAHYLTFRIDAKQQQT